MKKERLQSILRNIYGDKYSYEIPDVVLNKDEIKCYCREHGYFYKKVFNLIHHKTSCPLCHASDTKSPYKTKEQLIFKLKSKHGDTYDYSKVDVGSKKITLICPHHGEFTVDARIALTSSRPCRKCSTELNRTHVNDTSNIEVHRDLYVTWMNMWTRCTNPNYQNRQPTYKGCKICDEWKVFENFMTWALDNAYKKGYHLDKDLLSKGERIYSPETCCFVPNHINNALTRNQKRRGRVRSIGVTLKGSKFVARCNFGHKETSSLGSFDNEQDAFECYKKAKENYLSCEADKLFLQGLITERVYNGLKSYKVKQYDN